MDRDYARSLKALREVALDARRTSRNYSFLGSTFRETRAYFPGLRSMLREKSDSGLAKRLTTMGGILILLPIPIVTECSERYCWLRASSCGRLRTRVPP